MPTLSVFYGIIVRMQSERGGRHHEPHLHALYGDYEVVMNFEGDVLEGALPKKQQKLLEAWIAIHEEELIANWEFLQSGNGYFKIEPLR